MAALDFRVLGPLEVWRNGELVAIPAPKQRALLGFLLLRANEPVPQDELIDQLWGEDAPATARASLQNQVHALRKILGREVLERQPAGYVLHLEPGKLDLARFERLVAESRRADAKERAAKLREALAYWRGPPLVEFPSEPFAQREINRLDEERLAALEDRIDADLELGRHVDLVPELEALVGKHPLRERLWSQLMLALYRAGRQADALAAYRRAHHVFVSDLGIEPGVVLRELQRAVLVQDPALEDPERRIGSTLERAAGILPRGPRERAQSLYEYGVALLRTGDRAAAVSTLEAAARAAVTAGERGVEERARLYLSYLSVWIEGKSPLEHLAEAERAVTTFEKLEDGEGVGLALRLQSQMLRDSGRADEGLEVAERGAALGNAEEASCRSGIALSLALGTTPVDRAIAGCEEQLTAHVWDERPPLFVWSALVCLLAQAGRIDEARVISDRALTAAREAGMVSLISAVIDGRATAEFSAGNLAEATHHSRAGYAIVEVEDDRAMVPGHAADLARLLALSGDVREAERLALAARKRAAPDSFPIEVLWRRALALVAAYEGRADEAVQLSDEARARTAASDWLTFHGETLEEAATIQQLAGDASKAARMLHAALATYEQKGNVVGAQRVQHRIETDT